VVLAVRRQHRLTEEAQFQAVRQQGRSWAHPLLILGVLANGSRLSRCGFVVGKKLGSAVIRNRARRRVREAVRRHFAQIRPGVDLVWVVRPAVVTASFHAIEEAVVSLARRAGLIVRDQSPS